MAKTNIKKNANGYGYTYTDLAQIHNELEAQGMTYYQYIEPIDGVDYMMTVLETADGEKEVRRGCRIVEAKLSGKENPVQAYGASLTYSRRYSLLMALGWATTDDDAACLTVEHGSRSKPVNSMGASNDMVGSIKALAKEKGITEKEICQQGGVAKIEDMPAGQMKACLTWLKGI